eukprot:gene4124-8200_t
MGDACKFKLNGNDDRRTLLDVGDEPLIFILTFLAPFYDLINVTAVCQYLNHLVFSEIATILWTSEPMLLCIEPSYKYARYCSLYPNNSVYKPLALSLLSKCRLHEVEIHLFMDDLGPCLCALSTFHSISHLYLFLDRSLSGRLPLELAGISHLTCQDFPNLELLSIQPADDAKSAPIQQMSSIGCQEILNILGSQLYLLEIYDFTPPPNILELVSTYCPSLTELHIRGSYILDFSQLISNKLQVLELYSNAVRFDEPLHLSSLRRLACIFSFRHESDVEIDISSIPINIEELKLTFPPGYSNTVMTTIGSYCPALRTLDLCSDDTDDYMNMSMPVNVFTVHSLRALATGCPNLHSLRLPVSTNFNTESVAVLSEFSHLNRLHLWVYHTVALENMAKVLHSSPSLKEVIFLGFGPENANWNDVTTEFLERMVEWHDMKQRISVKTAPLKLTISSRDIETKIKPTTLHFQPI